MMVDCKNYRGIEYIQLQELPQNQREKLIQSISRDRFIKILIDGSIVSDCIQYKDYSLWYQTEYTKIGSTPSPAIANSNPVVIQELAFK